MRILSINICHGGGTRVQRLYNWIVGKSPDVVILTEWRNNLSGASLISQLQECGFECRASSSLMRTANGICVASRLAIIGSKIVTPVNAATGQMMLIDFGNQLRILGCYFPLNRFKVPFFEKCLDHALDSQDLPFILMGDLNTGRDDLDIEGTGTPFHCASHFLALADAGKLIDLWRYRHGLRQDWTWRSQKNGFRIDHALGNEAFLQQFPDFTCELDHSPRENGLTDHSAILLNAK